MKEKNHITICTSSTFDGTVLNKWPKPGNVFDDCGEELVEPKGFNNTNCKPSGLCLDIDDSPSISS